MGRYLDLVRQTTAIEGRNDSAKIGGHTVHRVIWQTEAAIVFQDETGAFWRYLHSYRQAWPVIIGARPGGNRGVEGQGQ